MLSRGEKDQAIFTQTNEIYPFLNCNTHHKHLQYKYAVKGMKGLNIVNQEQQLQDLKEILNV